MIKLYRLMLAAATLFTIFTIASQCASARNFFCQSYTGTRTDFTGNVGYEFVPETNLTITALGRSVSQARLLKAHQVTIWDTITAKPLAGATVSASSPVDKFGFAFQRLDHPLILAKGRSYRITSSEEKNGDPMMDLADITGHAGVAAVGTGVYETDSGYPSAKYGRDEQGYGLPTFYFDEVGVKPALLSPAAHGPTPFIRDIQAGYLLQCSFLSPRPYCWQGPDSLLSGWEVDKLCISPDLHLPGRFRVQQRLVQARGHQHDCRSYPQASDRQADEGTDHIGVSLQTDEADGRRALAAARSRSVCCRARDHRQQSLLGDRKGTNALRRQP
jgi:hypothetical protein